MYDGTGKPPFAADVRIRGSHIVGVGEHLPPVPRETVQDEHGLALAPGFIDMHSHGNDGLLEDLDAATISRQGITTILVGQDGESNYPLAGFYSKLELTPAAINVASMIGHATLREQAMGKDLFRPSSQAELAQMNYYNPDKVAQALADNGGASAIRFAHYTPEPAMAGKTLEQIAAIWNVSTVDAYMRIVKATIAEVDSKVEMEDIIATTMSDDDVRWFITRPQIMFCSDGTLHGAHPRGAGSFPRVLGRYVREQHALSLETAIHKMTGLPAQQLGLKDRARIAKGYVADLVIFDPATVLDQSTIEHPELPPLGIPSVMVSGVWVIDGGQVTGKHPGVVLRSAAYHP